MSLLSRIRSWLSGGDADSGPDATPHAPDRASEPTPVKVIDLREGFSIYRDGARFIDVREPHEWAQGHIAGAVHYPVADVEADPRLSVAPDTAVVTYCAAGARAARAAASLAAQGYSNVHALQSGYGDWQQAGYPVEVPNPDARG